MMVKNTKTWFEKAVPNPNRKNLVVQLGCHLEEVAELFEALDVEYTDNPFGGSAWKQLREHIDDMATALKKGRCHITAIDVNATLDALVDQKVTGTGVAHMLGMDFEGAVAEVDRSNWSKFDENGEPIFNADGKITKGPCYTEPNLKPFLPDVGRLRQVL